jgi:hypothetical protein
VKGGVEAAKASNSGAEVIKGGASLVKGGVEAAKASKEVAQGTKATKNVVKAEQAAQRAERVEYTTKVAKAEEVAPQGAEVRKGSQLKTKQGRIGKKSGGKIKPVKDAGNNIATKGDKPVLNDVNIGERTGSAVYKSRNVDDAQHFFTCLVDNYASRATKFRLRGGDGVVRNLWQIDGSLNGSSGIFEWIVEGTKVTHRRFIPGGTSMVFPINLLNETNRQSKDNLGRIVCWFEE